MRASKSTTAKLRKANSRDAEMREMSKRIYPLESHTGNVFMSGCRTSVIEEYLIGQQLRCAKYVLGHGWKDLGAMALGSLNVDDAAPGGWFISKSLRVYVDNYDNKLDPLTYVAR